MDKMTTFEKSALFFGPAMVIIFILQIPVISTLAAFAYAALAIVGVLMIMLMVQNAIMGNKFEKLGFDKLISNRKMPEWVHAMQAISKIAAFFTIGLTYPFFGGILLVWVFGTFAKFILKRIPAEVKTDETTIG